MCKFIVTSSPSTPLYWDTSPISDGLVFWLQYSDHMVQGPAQFFWPVWYGVSGWRSKDKRKVCPYPLSQKCIPCWCCSFGPWQCLQTRKPQSLPFDLWHLERCLWDWVDLWCRWVYSLSLRGSKCARCLWWQRSCTNTTGIICWRHKMVYLCILPISPASRSIWSVFHWPDSDKRHTSRYQM